jgi:hypothetical protein
MLINIDGWFGGGKSVLWSLLDGHKDVFVCPVHDYSFSTLIKETNDKEWLLKKNPVTLRKLLAESEYYKFEKVYYDRALPVCYSVDTFEYRPYTVDFYKFDQRFFKCLEKAEFWTIDFIVRSLYQTYYRVYHQLDNQKVPPKFIATMSHPGYFKDYINIPQILPDMKNILVRRGIKNIIATRINRNERPKDLNTFKAFRTPFSKVIESKEIEKIVDYFAEYERLSNLFPEQFMIVEFDDLIHDTEHSMRQVAKFLNIEYTSILTEPTRDGTLLEYQGLSFIGKENDDYTKLLSDYEINTVDKIIDEHKKGLISNAFERNLDFSKLLNRVDKFIENMKHIPQKIVIYGDSVFGRYVHRELSECVLYMVDQKVAKDEVNTLIRHPSFINNDDIDLVVVAVLGREDHIIDYLINQIEIPLSKIVCLNLND